MAGEANNREAFRIQDFYCAKMGAPIYARLCAAIAERADARQPDGARVLDWPGEPTRDALPLRFIGGLHALVRAGEDAGLARGVRRRRRPIRTAIAARRSTRRWSRMTTRCCRGSTARRRPTSRGGRAR